MGRAEKTNSISWQRWLENQRQIKLLNLFKHLAEEGNKKRIAIPVTLIQLSYLLQSFKLHR